MNLMELLIKVGVEDEATDKIKNIAGAVGTGLKKAAQIGVVAVGAVTAGAAALTGALISGASQIAAYGDNIDKMSQKMGMSSTAYQEWDAILQHSGTSIEGMQRGMMSLSAAAEKGSEAFEQIGISQERLATMSQEELFAETIKGLQGMEEGSERAVLAQKLLGGAAKELGPLLNTSAEETEAMRKRVHELGGVMGDDAVKASAKFQDSLQDMKTVFSGLKASIMTGFMPGITSVMDGITEIFSGNAEGGIAMVTEGINAISEQISTVVPALIELGTQILEPLIGAIADQLPTIITTLLPVIISSLGKLIVAIVQALPDILAALWTALKSIGAELWPVLEEAFSGLGAWFRNKFSEAWSAVKSVFAGWGQFFADLWDRISTTFSELGGKIGDAVSGAVTAGINSVIEFAESAVNSAIDLINGAINLINKLPGVSVGHIPSVNFPRLAIGNDYIPYDNYPAYLHRGEAVLTASEAEEWRKNKDGGRQIVNNFTFNGLSQSDLDFVVAYVNRGLG